MSKKALNRLKLFCLAEGIDTKFKLLLRCYIFGLILSPLLVFVFLAVYIFVEPVSFEITDFISLPSIFIGAPMIMLFSTVIMWPLRIFDAKELLFLNLSSFTPDNLMSLYAVLPLVVFPLLLFLPKEIKKTPIIVPVGGTVMSSYFVLLYLMLFDFT